MGRQKGSLNAKTIRNLEHLVGPEKKQDDPVDKLKTQVEQLMVHVDKLTKQLNEKQDPSYRQKIKSQYKLADIAKIDLLTAEQIKALEAEKDIILNEIEGKARLIDATLGGTVRVYENQTAPDDLELKRRLYARDKALALHSTPDMTDAELNKCKKRYNELSQELSKIIPSKKAQWAVGTPEYAEAIVMLQKMQQSDIQSKIREWQNIGKILDPDNSFMWNIDRLGAK